MNLNLMKSKLYYLLAILSILLSSCQTASNTIDIEQLNGYWEIESVTTSDHKVKQYQVNTTVEYFQVDKNLKGFRKKATADFSGTYKSNKRKDQIVIEHQSDQYYLITNTQVHSQKERILTLSSDKLILENETGNKYLYKRHQKLDFH